MLGPLVIAVIDPRYGARGPKVGALCVCGIYLIHNSRGQSIFGLVALNLMVGISTITP
jgi:hypothetical protein